MPKGITPIISVILLLLITIAMMGFAALFFQRSAQTATESGEQQLSQQTAALGENFEIINIEDNKVTIRNKGTSALSNLAFFVDGSPVSASGSSIARDGIGTFTLPAGQLAKYPGKELKVTSSGYSAKQDANFYAKNTTAYYTFDSTDGRTIKDDSGNGNDGTFSGEVWNDGTLTDFDPGNADGNTPPQQTIGKYGSGMSFDGVDDYVNLVGTNPILNSATSFTFEFWIYPETTGGRQQVIYKSRDGLRIGIGYGCIDFVMNINNVIRERTYPSYCISPVGANTWQHFVIAWNGVDGTLNVYKNGANTYLESGLAGTFTPDTSENYILGYKAWSWMNWLNGVIDEVRIYNRALTQGEIQENMNSAYPVNRTVASYSFENGAKDTHNVVKGKYGAALSFDGVDDKVQINNINFDVANKDFTMEAWYAPYSALDYWKTAVSLGGAGYGSAYNIIDGRWLAGLTAGSLNDNGQQYTEIFYNSAIANNAWNHVSVTHNKSANKLYAYANSQYVDFDSYTGSMVAPNSVITIGGGDSYFNGVIDEVRVLNTAIG